MANGIKVGSEANPCIRHVLKGAKKKCAEKIQSFLMFRMIKKLYGATHGDTPFWVAILLMKIPNQRNENLSESHIRDANNCPSSSSL